VGLVVGLVVGGYVLVPAAPTVHGTSVPPSLPTLTSCFGGGVCNGTSSTTTNGSGTACAVSGFSETAGDFVYVAIDYMGGSDQIVSVSDGGLDTFSYVGGEFANETSVAFYEVPRAHGGTVTVTVTISEAEFGACSVGQLGAGTMVGVVGPGHSVANNPYLTLSNAASHEPSLIMALFGSTRPTGDPLVADWPQSVGFAGLLAVQWTGSTYDGTSMNLFAENDSEPGTTNFVWETGNGQAPSISGIAVEFYWVG